MALFEPILGELSGKIAGNVFAHNRGGSYVRAWAIPTNPNTPQQQAVRTAMSNLVTAWSQELTQLQRNAWDNYAANVEMTNRLGSPIFLTGQNHFIRSNVPRIQLTLTRLDDAPTIFNLGEFAPISISFVTVIIVNITFNDTEVWADENDSHLLLYQSQPQSPTVNFFKSPFQFFKNIDGDSISPPTSPIASQSNFPFTSGQKAFVR